MHSRFVPDEALTREAVALAARLLQDAQHHMTRQEQRQAAKIAGMLADPHGKTMTMAMVDQAFRSHTPARMADQMRYVLAAYGMPRYLAWWERLALGLGSWLGRYLPHLIVPLIVARLRHETQHLIVPAGEDRFRAYLQKRRRSGTRLNINYLGEAILGEEEAQRRLQAYLTLLSRPDVEYTRSKSPRFSVKSTWWLLTRQSQPSRTACAPCIARQCSTSMFALTASLAPNSSTSTWRNTATCI